MAFDLKRLIHALNNEGPSRAVLKDILNSAGAIQPEVHLDIKRVLRGINQPGQLRDNINHILQNASGEGKDGLWFNKDRILRAFNFDDGILSTMQSVLDLGSGTPTGYVLDGTSPSMAYSAYPLMTAYETEMLAEETFNAGIGRVVSLIDQSGNGRNFTQPTESLQPRFEFYGAKVGAMSDGTKFMSGPLVDDVYGTENTWVVMAVRPDVIDRTGNAATRGNQVLGDTAEGGNLIFHLNGHGYVRSVQFDGEYKQTPNVPFYAGNVGVVQFRKDADKLYCRVNLLPEVEVPAGALTARAFNLTLFGQASDKFKGVVYAMAGYADENVPDLAKREQIVSRLMDEFNSPRPKSVSSYPSAATTGTTGSLTPVSGDQVYSTNGQVVEGLDITGAVFIEGDNITFRNCRVRSGIFVGIKVTGSNCIIEDCEIDGSLATINQSGVYLQGNNNILRRNNIHDVENTCQFQGDGQTMVDNYGHTFFSPTGDGHHDGFEANFGATNALIEHNTININASQTGCIQINNYGGSIDNIMVTDNLLIGGGYTVYVTDMFTGGTLTNVTVAANILGRGELGFYYYGTGVTSTGNIDLVSGFVA